MDSNEKQLIDALFAKIQQAAAQSGMRDAEVESLITEHMQRIPGAAYYMAQTIVIQREAVRQAEARIAELEQQLANRQTAQTSAPPPAPQQPQQQPRSGGGFLEGAAQTALGVAGGMFLARGIDNLVDSITGADRFFEDAVASNLVDDAVEDAYISGYEDAADDLEDLSDDLLGGDDLFGDDDWGF